ncbi:hypothetical protein GURASL_14090 [Geotalea uraniireducens]|uniref:DUF3047 domain-containing protein n=1 Tax=Geotalea uraniireducens TaxID=351604 RepID=A0ABN6VTG7_9BACT|nr:DUF3047 domain-containing protein [Geotalea uraniireducens]BDV42486.1 hypothetical protein GURASL_14090 [Geotalea uraniireducens]
MKMQVVVMMLLFVATSAGAAGITIGRFSAGDLTGWEEQTFRGKQKTAYALVPDGNRSVVRATSVRAASGLLKKVDIEAKEVPILRWSWKVGAIIRNGNARTKAGDDYPARIYVVFPRTFFWRTKAISYIWANHLPKGSSTPNAYTANVMMVAVESGSALVGKWVTEQRNVYEDYVRLFGEEPPKVGAVAIMTDTDNTGSEATAWYGDIFFDPR